jgi:hypothetical protein
MGGGFGNRQLDASALGSYWAWQRESKLVMRPFQNHNVAVPRRYLRVWLFLAAD